MPRASTPISMPKSARKATDNSKIMWTMHYLSDVYGPRLTGSPNHKAAAEWAVRTMTEWGFENAALEPWDFAHPGWLNERASGFITSPVRDNLTFEVLAWTPSAKKVKGQAFQIVIPRFPSDNLPNALANPTQAELNAYFDSIREQVKDKIVLVNKPAVVPVNFNPPVKRLNDDDLKKRYDPSATPSRPYTACTADTRECAHGPAAARRAGQVSGRFRGKASDQRRRRGARQGQGF